MKGTLNGSKSSATIVSQDEDICPMCSKEKMTTELQPLVSGAEEPGKAGWRGRTSRREPSINPSVEFSEEGTLACWVQKKKRTPSILRFTGAYSKRWLVIDPRTKTIEYSHAIDEQRKLLCEFRVGISTHPGHQTSGI